MIITKVFEWFAESSWLAKITLLFSILMFYLWYLQNQKHEKTKQNYILENKKDWRYNYKFNRKG